MKKIFAAILLGAAALGINAQTTEEMVFDLRLQSNFNLCSQTSLQYDHESYPAWAFSSYTQYITMYNYNITEGYYDDYLTTPDLQLQTGSMYVVRFRPSVYKQANEGKASISLYLGQGDDLETYTEIGKVSQLPYETVSAQAPVSEMAFTVPADGAYRLSFNAGPYSIYLKDPYIVNVGESGIPEPAQNFTVTPDPDGALNVTVSFTMPTTTITGQPLTAPKYNVYRGVQKIKNAVAAQPGENISFTETRGESGVLSYAVEIISGDETSEKLTIQTYIGPETPEAPSDVVMEVNSDTYSLTWNAPAVGIHGASLDPSKLRYNVYRDLSGTLTQVASGITACSFSEQLATEGLHTLGYNVEAVYGPQAKKSTQAESNRIRIGNISLPFSDSFAGAEIDPIWDNEIVTCTAVNPGSFNYWQAIPSISKTYTTTEPFDGDGGMLLYNAYQIQRNNSARLSTPAIAFEAGQRPVISFVKYNVSYTTATDRLKIQISCDYGDWVDVPDGSFIGYGEPVNTWAEIQVDLSGAIPAGTSSYRVGLLGESEYKYDILVDNLRIFNLMERDLELLSVTAPETVVAGNELTLSVKVANNGLNSVSASDYSLTIDSDFPGEITLPQMEDIPSMGNVVYTIPVELNSLHLQQADTFYFTASIEYSGDQLTSNNSFGPIEVEGLYGMGDGAYALGAVKNDDETITLSWSPANDLEYEPVNLTESFENEEWEDGFTGPFNGWTIIDLDGQSGDRWYSAGGSVFNLAKNPGTPGSTKDGSNVIGVTVKSNVTQNDWIISPLISCKEGREMTLKFLLGCKQISSYGNTYTVELLYTTEENYDILNPQNNFTNKVGTDLVSSSSSSRELPQDNKMYEQTFEGIPAEARYIALHFKSKGSYSPAMWIDNLRLTETDANPLLGYHVYDETLGGRLNEEILPSETLSYDIPASAASPLGQLHNVFVTAVYADGEAAPSNKIDLSTLVTSVESLDSTDPTDEEYYNLQGIRVARPENGIFIRRSGAKAVKVLK